MRFHCADGLVGTAQLRALQGTLVHLLHHQIGVRGAFKIMMD